MLLLAAAAAAEAGGKIKWEKSKEITYYPPATEPGEFGHDTTHIADKYRLAWSPYFNNDLDHILVRWSSWEWVATRNNSALEYGNLPRAEYDKVIAEERALREKYFIFQVTVAAKTEKFYREATAEYWEFRLLTEEGEVEPFGVQGKGSLSGKGFTTTLGAVSSDTIITDKLYENSFTVYFERPAEDVAATGLKFVIRGGDINRGFEWRFKE